MARLNPVKETRQLQLIEATIATIGRRGYAATTLSHVASAAGMSPGIVNFYFRTKEQLLAATLEFIAGEYESSWRTQLAAAGDSPAAQLEAMIEADFSPGIFTREKMTVWYAFWAEAPNQPLYETLVSELEQRYWSETRGIVDRLIAEGGYKGLDPDAVAHGLNAMIDGLWFDLLIDPNSVTPAQGKIICRLYLAGIFPKHFGQYAAGGVAAAAAAVEAAPYLERPIEEAAEGTDAFGRAAHRKRLSAALRRRLQPQGRLTIKELAAGIGVTTDTVQNWLNESTEPSSWLLGRLLAMLDPAFFAEAFGPAVDAMRRRFETRLTAEREAAEKDRAILTEIDPRPANSDLPSGDPARPVERSPEDSGGSRQS
jgi:TetR/AcrR family transcriptional repressor of bet genes